MITLKKIILTGSGGPFLEKPLSEFDLIAPAQALKHPNWNMGKKIFNLANEPKYSYFTKYDDHMMEYDEKLVIALKSFVDSLN